MSRRDIFLQGSIRNLKEFEDEGILSFKNYNNLLLFIFRLQL